MWRRLQDMASMEPTPDGEDVAADELAGLSLEPTDDDEGQRTIVMVVSAGEAASHAPTTPHHTTPHHTTPHTPGRTAPHHNAPQGVTGDGKSTTANTLCGTDAFDTSASFGSETAEAAHADYLQFGAAGCFGEFGRGGRAGPPRHTAPTPHRTTHRRVARGGHGGAARHGPIRGGGDGSLLRV